ncbi:DUF5080 family protein [Staphylococcus pettenkoferi]|uniref:DUF5080 family protein n=1 Tax=Staphylococcus pettenkoferi TaxID=170573 RepID=A0A9Q4H186_9STAP|nr:DUF5080 family protein [Staphylococcus pettenkoferi]MCY1569074.1 DUF5080 family protein [Staphylococcus pettenkoferi]MCY1575109.1 DUF5080 family protein [Staphylococcus pettenkoferi]MCY1593728.1 DUF5080 family protein [Staphylococcus pettenkoferi]MCY1618623.1 DUF5080 family protein [Staphylococcus pettenkoferi]
MLVIILLIVVFGYCYLLDFNAVLIKERNILFPIISSSIIIGIIFFVMFKAHNLNSNSLENIILISGIGFVMYMWLAIRSFSKRPRYIKMEKLMSSKWQDKENEEQLEIISVKVVTGNTRGLLCMMMAAVCLMVFEYNMTVGEAYEVIDFLSVCYFFTVIAIVVYIIIDIVQYIRYNIFGMYTLRPLTILLAFILLHIAAA